MSSFRTWPVPHNARMEKTIEPGQLLGIRGKILEVDLKEEGADPRMTVNLASESQGSDAANIPLQLQLRFKKKECILNTRDNGEWGKEEKPKMHWKPGDAFDIRIRVHDDHFELKADQKDWCKYEHRMPITRISHLFIDGPIMLENVSWGGKYYNVPYESGISGGFRPGKRLFVSGVPDKGCERFHINLVTGSGDIALHLNPRFKQKEIVRNTCLGGEWGKEEKEGEFPFKHGVVFDIAIVNEPYSMQIFVNNEQHSAYAHRADPNDINGIQVAGDIELQSVMVTGT